MLFIPIISEAELRHWPVMTGALIVINILAFGCQLAYNLSPNVYFLVLGDGLRPWQWLTSAFMHIDLSHLLGNMFFLWVFGLLVEGRLGWWRFLCLYLTLATLDGAILQIAFLGGDFRRVLGASGVIYSLMSLAMLWSPQENIRFVYFVIFLGFGLCDIPVLVLGIAFMGMDGWQVIKSNDIISTGALHLLGALLGFVTGCLYLWRQWVITDQRDLWSLIQEARGIELKPTPLSPQELREQEVAALAAQRKQELAWRSIDLHLQAGKLEPAWTLFRQMRSQNAQIQWDEHRLLKLLSVAKQNKQWKYLEIAAAEYLERFSSKRAVVALTLAKLYVEQLSAPRRALKVLQSHTNDWQTPEQHQLARQLQQICHQRIADGELEID